MSATAVRSFTTADAPGRCKRCLIGQSFCICSDVRPVPTRTEIVVVRHEREGWKSTGTARIAELAMPNLKMLEFTETSEPARSQLPEFVGGAHLLFPGDDVQPWTDVKRIIVIDGTWRQTRKMYGKLESLHSVPKLSLPAQTSKVLRLRESTFEEGRSTLEAIAEAIALVEGDDVAKPLFELHNLYVERVFRARGVWDQKKNDP